ncbi:MAG: hypothetical protein WAN03_16150 [Candidatus Sulfotelmatobacter sp.]
MITSESKIKWCSLDQAVNEVRRAFADVPASELDKLIDEAVKSVRKDRRRERKRRERAQEADSL